METNRISARIQAQKLEQKKDAAASGLTGAFYGAAAGVVAGNLRKPDIFEYTQTINKIGENDIKNKQKSLRKIAEAMDNGKKLSDAQKELLKTLDLADSSSNEIRKSASLLKRTNNTGAILNHLGDKIIKLESHIETLNNIDPNITNDSPMAKSLLEMYVDKNKAEFTIINDSKKAEVKTFTSFDKAVEFLKKRVNKYIDLTEKTVKVREAQLAGQLQTGEFIGETFADKKDGFRKFVVNEFKSTKAKKYALWGALTAGVAAAAADFASNSRSKKVLVPVKTIVPVPVPVALNPEK